MSFSAAAGNYIGWDAATETTLTSNGGDITLNGNKFNLLYGTVNAGAGDVTVKATNADIDTGGLYLYTGSNIYGNNITVDTNGVIWDQDTGVDWSTSIEGTGDVTLKGSQIGIGTNSLQVVGGNGSTLTLEQTDRSANTSRQWTYIYADKNADNKRFGTIKGTLIDNDLRSGFSIKFDGSTDRIYIKDDGTDIQSGDSYVLKTKEHNRNVVASTSGLNQVTLGNLFYVNTGSGSLTYTATNLPSSISEETQTTIDQTTTSTTNYTPVVATAPEPVEQKFESSTDFVKSMMEQDTVTQNTGNLIDPTANLINDILGQSGKAGVEIVDTFEADDGSRYVKLADGTYGLLSMVDGGSKFVVLESGREISANDKQLLASGWTLEEVLAKTPDQVSGELVRQENLHQAEVAKQEAEQKALQEAEEKRLAEEKAEEDRKVAELAEQKAAEERQQKIDAETKNIHEKFGAATDKFIAFKNEQIQAWSEEINQYQNLKEEAQKLFDQGEISRRTLFILLDQFEKTISSSKQSIADTNEDISTLKDYEVIEDNWGGNTSLKLSWFTRYGTPFKTKETTTLAEAESQLLRDIEGHEYYLKNTVKIVEEITSDPMGFILNILETSHTTAHRSFSDDIAKSYKSDIMSARRQRSAPLVNSFEEISRNASSEISTTMSNLDDRYASTVLDQVIYNKEYASLREEWLKNRDRIVADFVQNKNRVAYELALKENFNKYEGLKKELNTKRKELNLERNQLRSEQLLEIQVSAELLKVEEAKRFFLSEVADIKAKIANDKDRPLYQEQLKEANKRFEAQKKRFSSNISKLQQKFSSNSQQTVTNTNSQFEKWKTLPINERLAISRENKAFRDFLALDLSPEETVRFNDYLSGDNTSIQEAISDERSFGQWLELTQPDLFENGSFVGRPETAAPVGGSTQIAMTDPTPTEGQNGNVAIGSGGDETISSGSTQDEQPLRTNPNGGKPVQVSLEITDYNSPDDFLKEIDVAPLDVSNLKGILESSGFQILNDQIVKAANMFVVQGALDDLKAINGSGGNLANVRVARKIVGQRYAEFDKYSNTFKALNAIAAPKDVFDKASGYLKQLSILKSNPNARNLTQTSSEAYKLVTTLTGVPDAAKYLLLGGSSALNLASKVGGTGTFSAKTASYAASLANVSKKMTSKMGAKVLGRANTLMLAADAGVNIGAKLTEYFPNDNSAINISSNIAIQAKNAFVKYEEQQSEFKSYVSNILNSGIEPTSLGVQKEIDTRISEMKKTMSDAQDLVMSAEKAYESLNGFTKFIASHTGKEPNLDMFEETMKITPDQHVDAIVSQAFIDAKEEFFK